jgi:glycosyltransferase involved in cell wall biosynthesis
MTGFRARSSSRPETKIGGAPGERTRVLALAPFPPRLDGRHGGARVIAELLLGLATRADVALLALRGPDDARTDPELTEALHVVELEYGKSILQRSVFARSRQWAGLARGRPIWATTLRVPAFSRLAKELVRTWRPDVVQFDFSVMAQYSGIAGSLPTVLIEHDPVLAATSGEPRGVVRTLSRHLEAHAWRRAATNAFRHVDAIVAFSDEDAATIHELVPAAPVRVIHLGARVRADGFTAAETDPPRLLFVGSFRHLPNVEAASRLASVIFPRVRRTHPLVELDLVGHAPPPEVLDLAGGGVHVHGDVAEVAPYIARAAAVVVPIDSGGGVRVKVLDALAAGKAAVASPLALDGIDVPRGSHVVVACTDEEFVESVCRLLDDPEHRLELGRRAHAWAQANLSWDRAVDALVGVHADVIHSRVGRLDLR